MIQAWRRILSEAFRRSVRSVPIIFGRVAGFRRADWGSIARMPKTF